MFLSRLAAIAAVLLLVSNSAFADGTTTHLAFTDSFDIGLEGEYYQYREPLLDNDLGPGFGLNATYTANWNRWFFKANLIADFFDVDYSSNGTGTVNGVTNYLQDYRALFGHDFKVSRQSDLMPYVGVGFRVLFDSSKASSSTGALGYDRRSEYLYIPLGVTYSFRAGRWGIAPTMEYDYFIQGWQSSYTSDTGLDNNLYNQQNVGWGGRADVMITPPVDFYHFSFGPYLRYWSIHDSNVEPLYQGGVLAGYGLEPSNNTLELGVRTQFRFE